MDPSMTLQIMSERNRSKTVGDRSCRAAAGHASALLLSLLLTFFLLLAKAAAASDSDSQTCTGADDGAVRAQFPEVHADASSWGDLLAPHVERGRPVVIRGGVSDWVDQAESWWRSPSTEDDRDDVATGSRPHPPGDTEGAFVSRFADAQVQLAFGGTAYIGFFGPDRDGEINNVVRLRDALEDNNLIFAQDDPTWLELVPDVEWANFVSSSFLHAASTGIKRNRAIKKGESELVDRINSVGGSGVGLPFHVHEDATLGLLLGVKHWVVVPPPRMTEELLLWAMRGIADHSGPWCPDARTVAGAQHALCVTQKPGDVVYVPASWWHATRNDDEALVTVGAGAQLKSMQIKSDFFQRQVARGPDGTLDSPVFRTFLSKFPGHGHDVLVDSVSAWASGPPSWITSSEQLLANIKNQEKERPVYGAAFFAVVFEVACDRVNALADDKSLALTKRDRAALIAQIADAVGNGLDRSLMSIEAHRMALAQYDKALAMDPELSPRAWHNSAYTELMLLQAGQEDASVGGVRDRLWRALKIDSAYGRSLEACDQLGLDLPPANK